jgi:hypothetical protein
MKDAISSLYRLQGLGLQRLKISLPKIVVLGKSMNDCTPSKTYSLHIR